MVPPFSIIGMRRSVTGSMIGGIAETQEMLDFCAAHGIASEVEVIEPDYINEGLRAGHRQRCPVSVRHRHRIPAQRVTLP